VEAAREVSVEKGVVQLELDRVVTSRENLERALDDAGFSVRDIERE